MSILSTTGDITRISPRKNVQKGKKESNTKIFLFQERENLRLSRNVNVDISSPGYYAASNSLTPGIISAGTPVDSYFLHFDRKGSTSKRNGAEGSVTFDEEILGLIVNKDTQNATTDILGRPGTTYGQQKGELELTNNTDSITWSGNALHVRLRSNYGLDQIRVITEHSVPPTLTSFRLNGSNSNITISEGNSVSALLEATDPNRDAISFFLNCSSIGTDFRVSGTRSQSNNLGVFRDNGTFTYRGQAKDEDGKYSNTIARTVTVNNVAPTLTGFNLSSNFINEGQSASAFLSATDPGADRISFSIDGRFINTDFRTSGTREASTPLGPFQNDGTFTLSARSQDSDGADSDTVTRTLTVNNVAPTITSLTEDLSIISTNNTFSFAATATDPGLTDILTYEWGLDGDGEYDDFTGSSGEWSFSEPGDHEVKLRVSDGDGGFDEDTFTVTAVEPNIIEIYSFRFTDIKAVSDDPEGDKFQFSFEIINWTDTPAAGIKIALNYATNLFSVDGRYPEFAGATVDENGRTFRYNRDPITANLNLPNDGTVSGFYNTSITWNIGGPILNRDLLGTTSNEQACALVPGCDILSGEPRISDIEAVDNGDNVRDGFVFNVDNWDESEILSFDLPLLDENGNAIPNELKELFYKNVTRCVDFYGDGGFEEDSLAGETHTGSQPEFNNPDDKDKCTQQLTIATEYFSLAILPELSDSEADRLEEILERAIFDDHLSSLINKIDCFVLKELKYFEPDELDRDNNQIARIKEFLVS